MQSAFTYSQEMKILLYSRSTKSAEVWYNGTTYYGNETLSPHTTVL